MTTKPLPPALSPYLRLPPEASLTLLTGTLACSVNWLTCRFISAALTSEEPRPVVLVSWLRDLAFWRSEMKRTTGIDISRFPEQFVFIDAFTTPKNVDTLPSTSIPPLLILDTPTLSLLFNPSIPLLHLRSQAHATILISNADAPLLQSTTPVETTSANFLTTAAHASRMVMSVRELETGAARDVSGVLRVTNGGDGDGEGVEEREMLYFVGRDGGVRVFGRGEE